jgi:predicted transcriptional regulator
MRSVISGEAKIKNKPPKRSAPRVTVSSVSVEAFIGRSLDRARRLDRGEKLPHEITVSFEDPADLVRVLSAERVRVVHAVRETRQCRNSLRHSGATGKQSKRDVTLLESFGLVNAREEINPGHGRKRVIELRAAKYQLVATI